MIRDFSLARAVLASAYTQQIFYNDADPALEQKAFLEIERAVAINPDQAKASFALATHMEPAQRISP